MSTRWEIEQVEVRENDPQSFTALRLHCKFPLGGDMRRAFAALLPKLQDGLQDRCRVRMQRSLFLQMAHLPRPDGSAALSRHASDWMPGLAIGVSPDGEPPRSMCEEDFTHRLPGTPFAVPRGEGRQILATEEINLAAVEDALAGSGALLEIFAREGWLAGKGQTVSRWLLDRITDESYRAFPFYVPLLDAAMLGRLPASAREHCLAGVELYLREDAVNNEVLLLARLSFEDTMHLLNG